MLLVCYLNPRSINANVEAMVSRIVLLNRVKYKSPLYFIICDTFTEGSFQVCDRHSTNFGKPLPFTTGNSGSRPLLRISRCDNVTLGYTSKGIFSLENTHVSFKRDVQWQRNIRH